MGQLVIRARIGNKTLVWPFYAHRPPTAQVEEFREELEMLKDEGCPYPNAEIGEIALAPKENPLAVPGIPIGISF